MVNLLVVVVWWWWWAGQPAEREREEEEEDRSKAGRAARAIERLCSSAFEKLRSLAQRGARARFLFSFLFRCIQSGSQLRQCFDHTAPVPTVHAHNKERSILSEQPNNFSSHSPKATRHVKKNTRLTF